MTQVAQVYIGVALIVAAFGLGALLMRQGGYLHIRLLSPYNPTDLPVYIDPLDRVDEYTRREKECFEQQHARIADCEQASHAQGTEECAAGSVQAMLQDCLQVE